MPVEAGHLQLLEYQKEVIPRMNWMFEDLFCIYGVSIPYYLLDFGFPDYQIKAEWPAPYSPEWLALYRPKLPPWPEMQWPNWFSAGFDWLPQFNGFNFNMDWGGWGYDLPWLNQLLGLLFDLADIPRWEMPDWSPASISRLNDYIIMLYDAIGVTRTLSTSDVIAVAESISVAIPDISVYNDTYYAALIQKKGIDPVLLDAIAAYPGASVEGGEGVSTGKSTTWGIGHSSGNYRAGGAEICLIFDTSNTPIAKSVKLRLKVASFSDTGYGTPTLELYEIDSAFSTSHYLAGTYITNQVIDSAGTYNITLSNDDINYGGTTRIKLSLDTMGGSFIESAVVQSVTLTVGINSNTRLIFTY